VDVAGEVAAVGKMMTRFKGPKQHRQSRGGAEDMGHKDVRAAMQYQHPDLLSEVQRALRQQTSVEVCVSIGLFATSAYDPSSRSAFKNRCWHLRLPIVPHQSEKSDCLFAGLALWTWVIPGPIRRSRHSSSVCPFRIGARR
jgi:hypothetical protein